MPKCIQKLNFKFFDTKIRKLETRIDPLVVVNNEFITFRKNRKFKNADMIEILTWTSIIAGGILILLLILSIVGGLDLDVDVGSTEIDADGGGLGVVKGFLTFISVSSWIIKVLVAAEKHLGVALGIGIFSGLLALFILNYIFRLLLQNEANVNWSMSDALFEKGEVYLKIPASNGNGIVNINIKGVTRELKALSVNNEEIKTGESIVVVEIEGEYVKVRPA